MHARAARIALDWVEDRSVRAGLRARMLRSLERRRTDRHICAGDAGAATWPSLRNERVRDTVLDDPCRDGFLVATHSHVVEVDLGGFEAAVRDAPVGANRRQIYWYYQACGRNRATE